MHMTNVPILQEGLEANLTDCHNTLMPRVLPEVEELKLNNFGNTTHV
uniref:Uncharacterized protein n=1 Tax=viral metagenome TaxID=1070528 RepID=A0A6C0J3D4_9ZZZZ